MLSISVELVTGRGRFWWPRPGRLFVASPCHTFAQLAEVIDVAFGRRDLEHLRTIVLPGASEVSWVSWRDGPAFPGTRDGRTVTLDILTVDDVFAYVFDLGQDWTHLCTVRSVVGQGRPFDPVLPPRTSSGWGDPPDQYGRPHRSAAGPSVPLASPPAPEALPPILPSWQRPTQSLRPRAARPAE
ncbi:plasmid pRiA4b ORF-3 family protein [Micromonospora sp. WMMB482]|uniref:plasmid pRiA4b ORF-3 family protein n=1 Tax=Micromonospora sp. WMMB482 TaxID=2849653 RepID=UPI001C222D78|nr:plasmid pRiA4b ORF-3 family protein [Micromonospora sp. WMMB482]MBU8858588.1 plasmid pRiA4b ORF-3 family protein [Micromonospora sp. WMMB482]